MHIEKMKLSDLRPAEYNPRVKLNPGMAEYEKLKQSILEFGFVDPPIFNKNLELTGFDNEELEILIEDADIPNFEPGSIDDQGDLTKLEPKFVKCPCCGEEFDLRDVES